MPLNARLARPGSNRQQLAVMSPAVGRCCSGSEVECLSSTLQISDGVAQAIANHINQNPMQRLRRSHRQWSPRAMNDLSTRHNAPSNTAFSQNASGAHAEGITLLLRPYRGTCNPALPAAGQSHGRDIPPLTA